MRNSALGYFGALCTLKTTFSKTLVSSSAAERNWSTYDFIHSKKRNRLTEAKARDLVYVHSNLRLLDKISDVNFTDTTVQWEQWAIADSESEAEEDENNDSA